MCEQIFEQFRAESQQNRDSRAFPRKKINARTNPSPLSHRPVRSGRQILASEPAAPVPGRGLPIGERFFVQTILHREMQVEQKPTTAMTLLRLYSV